MIKEVVIIEDEKLNADRLKRLIRLVRHDVEILCVLDSIADSVEWFKKHDHPDLVMMDVRLSDGLSFEIFEQIKIESPIIFTTAYDEYAVRAFKYNSVDYLLKPVEEEELEIALTKLENNVKKGFGTIEGLVNFLQPKEFRSRFLLPFRDSYKSVFVSDVIYFYSEMKITHAKLKDGTFEIIPQTMEELELQLDPKLFFRANRQFILHINGIKRLHNYFNGKLKIELIGSSENEVIVSREKAGLLKSWMDF